MHLNLIFTYTNLNASMKLVKNQDEEKVGDKSNILEQSKRDTNQKQGEQEDITAGSGKSRKTYS